MSNLKPLVHKTTAERTDEELRLAYEVYVLSKTVEGRYCPTPELGHAYDDDDAR